MTNENTKTGKKLSIDDRVIDILERFAAASLYMTTELKQIDIAKVLGMGNDRINQILKGISKQK